MGIFCCEYYLVYKDDNVLKKIKEELPHAEAQRAQGLGEVERGRKMKLLLSLVFLNQNNLQVCRDTFTVS